MQLTGHIYDSQTGDGAGYASVVVVDQAGNNVGSGTVANASGDFYLNSTRLDQGGANLQFTKIGYDSLTVPPSEILERGYVNLDPDPTQLADVTVTAKRPSYMGYIIAGVVVLGIGVYVSSRGKKRAIGKLDATNYMPYILLALGGVGIYLLVKNFSSIFGSNANTSNNSAVDQATRDANDRALADAKNAGYAQTIADGQLASLANDIWNQAVSSAGIVSVTAQNRIIQDVEHIQTIADVYALKKAFGTKQGSGSYWSTCNWLGFNCQSLDLDTVISMALDQSAINAINSYLSSRNINYQF